MMGQEISRAFDVKLIKNTYDEYFNKVKSGGPDKLVIVIDEAQYALKKDEGLKESLIKLRNKRLYPGPVLIVLCSSSIVWVEQDVEECFGSDAKKIDSYIKLADLNFLEVVRHFGDMQVRDISRIYRILG